MAITIQSPRFSFYNFTSIDEVVGCGFKPIGICLPIYEASDVAFQFFVVTSTPEEADLLCGLANDNIQVGIVEQCTDDFLLAFEEKPERTRGNENMVIYSWPHGLPGFTDVISIGECFHIKIIVNGTDSFCSGCLSRIGDDCYTAVLDYSNDDDAFGFSYCSNGGGSTTSGNTTDQACEPTIVQFNNLATLNIPYTTSLQQKYGPVPTVQVWVFIDGELVDIGLRVSFDDFPPTLLIFDFGGVSSGIIKIS